MLCCQHRTEPYESGIRNTGNIRSSGSWKRDSRGWVGRVGVVGAECGLRGRSRTPTGEGGKGRERGTGEGNEPRQLISPGFHNALANERPL